VARPPSPRLVIGGLVALALIVLLRGRLADALLGAAEPLDDDGV
jgi:hypothetical protein